MHSFTHARTRKTYAVSQVMGSDDDLVEEEEDEDMEGGEQQLAGARWAESVACHCLHLYSCTASTLFQKEAARQTTDP
jgi:hypothetical protein